MVTLLRQLGLKGEAAIDYADGFVTSDLKKPEGDPCKRVANDVSKNGILEQRVAKRRMNGFLHTALERIESGK